VKGKIKSDMREEKCEKFNEKTIPLSFILQEWVIVLKRLNKM
jgi:hypothetical protein